MSLTVCRFERKLERIISDALEKLRKVRICLVMPFNPLVSLSLSPHIYYRGPPHYTDFLEFDTADFYEKSVEKVQVWLQSGKNMWHFI